MHIVVGLTVGLYIFYLCKERHREKKQKEKNNNKNNLNI